MNLRTIFSVVIGVLALPSICLAQDPPTAMPTDMIWIMNTMFFRIGFFWYSSWPVALRC